MIETQDLVIGYHKGQELSAPLNIHIREGEFICLLGPNGSGKSTLIRTLAGIIPTIRGDLLLNNDPLNQYPVKERAKNISLLLTDPIESSRVAAKDYVAMGRTPYLNWWGKFSQHDDSEVLEAMNTTHMLQYASKKLNNLSDGEKQRVSIARALAQDTPIILMDEPTSHLDLGGKIEIMQLIKKLTLHKHKGILISTHDLNLAIQMAAKLWLFDHYGNLYQGTAEDFILNGTLQKCFDLDEEVFDFSSGRIGFHHETDAEVHIEGEGKHYFWTKHALERCGYTISKKASVKIYVDDKNGTWQLLQKGKKSEHQTIERLLNKIGSY